MYLHLTHRNYALLVRKHPEQNLENVHKLSCVFMRGGRCSRYKKVLYHIESLSGSGGGLAGCLEEVEGTGRVKRLVERGKINFSANVLVFPKQNNF